MDAEVVTSPQTWPGKERDLAQLAYEVGPRVDYPGFADATPTPTLPLAGLLLLGCLLVARGIHGRRPRGMST